MRSFQKRHRHRKLKNVNNIFALKNYWKKKARGKGKKAKAARNIVRGLEKFIKQEGL